jgi:hypothetical protein
MHVIFDNNTTIEFEFLESPVTDYYRRAYKHLQHVPLQFNLWDLPYIQTNCFQNLQRYAKPLGIDIDILRLKNQDYMNQLHEIYEKNYDGAENWLFFHEHIHLCEDHNSSHKNTGVYHIDWREKAGPITGKYKAEYTKSLVTKTQTGQIFFKWSELGKIPYTYWKDGEPDNIERICQLAKPMLAVRPKIQIACTDIDFLANKDAQGFNRWWSQFHSKWCNHWGLTEWKLDQMFGIIPYAQTQQVDQLRYLAENKHCPVKIKI